MANIVRFKYFINESFIELNEAAGAISDAKGKAFELELAKNLHPKKQYPEHHNDDAGRSPTTVANKLKDTLGHDEYEKISSHAKIAAHEHLTKTGHKPKDVHWTSVEGQVSKTTGKNDAGNQSDIVYKNHDGTHYGISAKYGKQPSARSSGLRDIASMSGIKHEKLEAMQKEHLKAVHDIMKDHVKSNTQTGRHAEFKKAASGLMGPEAKDAANHALKTSLVHRKNMMGHVAHHFNKLATNDHAAMMHVIRKITASSGTETSMMKIHHNPSNGKTFINHPKEDFDKAMKRVKHFSVEHKGMSIHIHAHDHDGNVHKVAIMDLKNHRSSPYPGVVGSTKIKSGIERLAGHE